MIKKRKVMPIPAKAMEIPDAQPTTYAGYRKNVWASIDHSKFDAGDSSYDGVPLHECKAPHSIYLEPMRNQNFHDIWHCSSTAWARALVQKLSSFDDVTFLKFEGRFVWAKFMPAAGGWMLEGQKPEQRGKVFG